MRTDSRPAGESGPAPQRDTAPVSRQVAVHNNQVRSEALMDSAGLLWIEHDNSLYQLRRTASGKLILTK